MEPTLDQIYRLLEAALQASTYYDLRSRLASTEQWDYERAGIEKDQYELWNKAKALICNNKEEVDKYLAANKPPKDPGGVGIKNPKYEAISAAVRVIEEEMTHLLEVNMTEET